MENDFTEAKITVVVKFGTLKLASMVPIRLLAYRYVDTSISNCMTTNYSSFLGGRYCLNNGILSHIASLVRTSQYVSEMTKDLSKLGLHYNNLQL